MQVLFLSLGLGAVRDFLASGTRLGFIPTAGEPYDDPYFVRDDRERLSRLGYIISDIDITEMEQDRIVQKFAEIDCLFVAGGNTFYLMQQLRLKGLIEVFHRYIDSGRRYIGASAGAVICGPTLKPITELDDATAAPKLTTMDGLGVVNFVVLPHYGKPKYLGRYNAIIERYANDITVVPLRDNEAISVVGPDQFDIIPSELIFHA